MVAVPSGDGQQRRGAIPAPLLAAWALFAVIVAGVAAWLIIAGPPDGAPSTRVLGQVVMPAQMEPRASVPAAEAPLAEAPLAEAPLAEAALAEIPLAEAPLAEAPLAEIPLAEAPLGEAPPAVALPEAAPEPVPEPEPEPGPPAPPQPAPQLAMAPIALTPAPDPGLIEQTALGPLPRIGIDGREPWQVYSRPFDNDDPRPRIAVVVSGLGRSSGATEAAIQDLPGAVTLAFLPYGRDLQHWINLARAAGHEVLLNLPMEPLDYPANDPGPNTLLTALSPDQNQSRLNWILSRVTGYVGVTNHMGSRFTASEEAMAPVIETLRSRGLLFLDSREAARSMGAILATRSQVPRAIVDRFVDKRVASRAVIDANLAEVERVAIEKGVALAMGQQYPVTIERLRVWLDTLDDKGIALAPISAMVNMQEDR